MYWQTVPESQTGGSKLGTITNDRACVDCRRSQLAAVSSGDELAVLYQRSLGSSQHSPDPLAAFKRGKRGWEGRDGKKGKRGEEKEMRGKGRKKGKGGKEGMRREPSHFKML